MIRKRASDEAPMRAMSANSPATYQSRTEGSRVRKAPSTATRTTSGTESQMPVATSISAQDDSNSGQHGRASETRRDSTDAPVAGRPRREPRPNEILSRFIMGHS